MTILHPDFSTLLGRFSQSVHKEDRQKNQIIWMMIFAGEQKTKLANKVNKRAKYNWHMNQNPSAAAIIQRCDWNSDSLFFFLGKEDPKIA